MMDALIFGLFLLIFILVLKGRKKPAAVTFGVTMLLFIYWFSYHVTDKIDINL